MLTLTLTAVNITLRIRIPRRTIDAVNTHPLRDITHPLGDITHPLRDITHPLSDITHPLSDIAHPLREILRRNQGSTELAVLGTGRLLIDWLGSGLGG